jgi:hypothetical protein
MTDSPVRYRSSDEDSGRWRSFTFRDGDIVISTRSKSGTTWVQMICALLIFQSPTFPDRLDRMSPWLDWLAVPLDDVLAQLDGQQHRRFIKTHTPLDGIPIDPRAIYIVTARHPLDLAVSLYHQGDNLDRARMRQLTGAHSTDADEPARPALHDWLVRWIDVELPPVDFLDSLNGVMWHLTDAWSRRDQPNVMLVHYDELRTDLDSAMRRIASRLDIATKNDAWPELVSAARFDAMRSRAEELAPDPVGVLKDRTKFFRGGTTGSGAEALSREELERYHARVKSLAPPALLAWLHRYERSSSR